MRRELHETQRLQRLKDNQEVQISKTQNTQNKSDLELIDVGEAISVMEQAVEQILRSGCRVTKPLRFQV